MKRPADQAKLLFFYLLRSSAAALATTSPSSLSSSASSSASMGRPWVEQGGHLCVRLARRTDVPSIQRCNLATLPENYNSHFYVTHLRQWPELALVAEHVVPPPTNNNSNQNRSPFRAFPGRSQQQPEGKIVGYVLGKVEERPTMIHHDGGRLIGPHSNSNNNNNNNIIKMGHVTSLAVLHEYRRHGLAGRLMAQLHYHLEQCHGADAVGLHVRTSNAAAVHLYQRAGYRVEHVIPHYYQDGEDAYFMRKPLLMMLSHSNQEESQSSRAAATEPPPPAHAWESPAWRGSRNNHNNNNNNNPRPCWETGPLHLRLPREEPFGGPPPPVPRREGAFVQGGPLAGSSSSSKPEAAPTQPGLMPQEVVTGHL